MSCSTKDDDCFIHFNESIESYSLPLQFNYPFNYEPHPLCRLAAKQLQYYLETQTEWKHDFGIDHSVDGINIGKMFGILLVRNEQNETGFLAAFSGKLAGTNLHPSFVPPIVDLLQENSFYRKGENEISNINHTITAIEESPEYLHLKELLETQNEQKALALELYRLEMKAAKQARDVCRAKAQHELSLEDFATLKNQLKNESLKKQYDYKLLSKQWKELLDESQRKLDFYLNKIAILKDERKMKSASLQQRMFDQYKFLNSKGETKIVCEIFLQTEQKVPPAGAGDCAAPKLLQYAYQHQMQPLAMAEFWWGQSPKSEIRKHGCFYPACRSKCEPILKHMLEGVDVAVNPVLIQPKVALFPSIIFEDASLLIINKPAEYLSVRGKTGADSVFDFIKRNYPDATGPLIVHRLDMSTSGLMVIAKTMEAYLSLQKQFENRTIKKRYIALLEGIVTGDEGHIDLPLRVDLDNRPRQLVCYEYGKSACTKWKVLERKNNRTRILFSPITGRTHQLRVHAAHPQGLNCPIVGDDLYGERSTRLYLHAEYLELIYPDSNKVLTFQTDAEF